MYPYYPFNTSPYSQQQTQNIQYVKGREAVDSIYLPPNSSGIYMDSGTARFYTKHTDASGVATIKSFDFKETEPEKPMEYVTKTEFESFKEQLKGVKNESVDDARE